MISEPLNGVRTTNTMSGSHLLQEHQCVDPACLSTEFGKDSGRKHVVSSLTLSNTRRNSNRNSLNITAPSSSFRVSSLLGTRTKASSANSALQTSNPIPASSFWYRSKSDILKSCMKKDEEEGGKSSRKISFSIRIPQRKHVRFNSCIDEIDVLNDMIHTRELRNSLRKSKLAKHHVIDERYWWSEDDEKHTMRRLVRKVEKLRTNHSDTIKELLRCYCGRNPTPMLTLQQWVSMEEVVRGLEYCVSFKFQRERKQCIQDVVEYYKTTTKKCVTEKTLLTVPAVKMIVESNEFRNSGNCSAITITTTATATNDEQVREFYSQRSLRAREFAIRIAQADEHEAQRIFFSE